MRWSLIAYAMSIPDPADAHADQILEKNQQVHLAVVYDGKSLSLYIDGELQGNRIPAELKKGRFARPFFIGAIQAGDEQNSSAFRLVMDQVRISKVARYTEDFTPAKRFEPDEHTLALYHFDEGSGDVLKDWSGNGHHGKIVGAKWVRVDDELKVLTEGKIASESHVWPNDQPAPAIAPFTSDQAKQHQEAWAKHLGLEVETTNSIGMKFRVIPPGEFLMGSSDEEIESILKIEKEREAYDYHRKLLLSEQPRHRVRLTDPYLMCAHEVTVAQFRKFVESSGYKTEAETDGKGGVGFPSGKKTQKPEWNWKNPSIKQDDNCPVMQITWKDAVAFCEWLSNKEGVRYRLPTEAQWEQCCRAGTETTYSFGKNSTHLEGHAWVVANANYIPQPVMKRQPNAFRIFDMHGNVGEWCHDKMGFTYYRDSPVDNPTGTETSSTRVLRGSSAAADGMRFSRSAFRHGEPEVSRNTFVGFRVLREIKQSVATADPDRKASE